MSTRKPSRAYLALRKVAKRASEIFQCLRPPAPPPRQTIETLEERRLLAWGSVPLLIDQDVAATRYPVITGRGTIVDLDTGINFGHMALAGRIWKNPLEIPNNGIDDDRSGKIDDVSGWDFVNNDNNPSDDQGHGTMTAGIMVANKFINTGNNQGYAGDRLEYRGIASGAKVIPLKIADAAGRINSSHLEQGLRWVLANKSRFNIVAVNLSLSVSKTDYDSRIRDELDALWKGGVFIAAASGNGYNTNNAMGWPASGPYSMSVGALNPDDSVANVTSRGPSLDILAPGNKIVFPARSGSQYYLGGAATSYATPFITAAAALIKQVNPKFTPDQIISILRDSGVNVYDPVTRLTFKRLDLDNAISKAWLRWGTAGAAPITAVSPTTSVQTTSSSTSTVLTPTKFSTRRINPDIFKSSSFSVC